ncbi:hypothetical protein HU200_062028 [Digitaria exilis]|uniref:Leucine-rich repeat-containing N-terminal plant-type domain-containing protein n=1 Tax=Digitaria exilis TaxID=1010633 RepID=A0A835E0Z2_9POAL|nr:hypothetical protein HU200_062028 [Digitaria exilis]
MSISSACTEQEKRSLLQFLTGLSQDGGLAASWHNGTDCCLWEGITCNGKRGIREVSLPSRGLEGHISPSLGDLHGMLRLNLSGNTLAGPLPDQLMGSSSIVSLDVSFNHLSGGLQELPSSTPDRPLQVLNISSNFFAGVFPSTTWEKTRNLVALNASNNSFSGWIPSSVCISSPDMTMLDLSYNQFSGYINPGLGKCSALRVLKAGHNNITGTLPDELFNATSLEYLSLSNNQLGGTLKAANIIKLKNLAFLDLAANGFISGKVPDSIGHLTKLEELYLNHNNLSGEFPAALTKCTNVRIIKLRDNNFEGELNKVNFSTLSNLRILDLCTNQFTGPIPESLYSCNNLVALRLSLNQFNGQLSERVANLKTLTFISLSENNFTNVTNTLHVLKSSRNLTVLLSGNNYKHEALPQDETMDGFENLQVLVLSDNHLTGPIPPELDVLHFLSELDCSNNDLEGPIPTGGQFETFSNSSFAGNPKLCGPILARQCVSAEAPPAPITTREQTMDNTVFAIAFSAFFVVGVMYDQIVLSKELITSAARGSCPAPTGFPTPALRCARVELRDGDTPAAAAAAVAGSRRAAAWQACLLAQGWHDELRGGKALHGLARPARTQASH